MTALEKVRSLKLNEIFGNYHFWIILTITSVFLVFYYGWQNWFPWFWRFFVFEFRNDVIGSLFFIPFLYASIVFWWRGSLIVWFLSAAAMLPCVIYWSSDLGSLITNVALSSVPIAAVIIFTLELKWRQAQRKTSIEREEERQIYMSQIFKAQEDERRRIAQELHDDAIQELSVIVNRAQKLASGKIATISEARECGKSIKSAVVGVSDEIRRISRDLRPSILDNVGLVSAIRWLVDRLNEEEGINGSVVVKGIERGFSSESEVTIFRIVQEALNNVRQHSGATQVLVTVEFSPEFARIVIKDNGKGFNLDRVAGSLAAKGKIGIMGMQQRAKLLNATFSMQSQPGKGTRVSIEVVDGLPDKISG